MLERTSHHELLTQWRADWTGSLTPSQLVELFERAVNALWRRAHLSLGELTLVAIVERVIHLGGENAPLLKTIQVTAGGVDFSGLRQVAPTLEHAGFEECLVGLVYELLRVLGTLTGEILTPGLHAELREVKPSPEDSGKEQS